MPGILPMKVIKVGANAQTRIAQACDRCRSKKIRCDGIRPSCTQCVNVGFECKTSDKLSRRAFPRGYTESLEERVRCLEGEVRELKALLDEKDEKIDMLSRIHSHSPQSMHSPRKPSFSSPAVAESIETPPEPNDVFRVVQSPMLLDDESRNSYFMGTSSGRTLIESFKNKLQESGRSAAGIDTDKFFQAENKPSSSPGLVQPHCVEWKAPPRLVSDQLINIFFQEWAPLFPVLHRPSFLALYEEYVSCPEAMEDKRSLAQLHLVFGIAALSSDSRNGYDIDSFEAQWQAALEHFLMDNSMSALQCLVLAQIYCLQRADYARLLKYKGLAISLSHRLGLHQSQKRFALGALTSETRKKLFWTLYTLDCFSAAQLGLPQLMKEEDVHCEFPVDADDEYVTEKGFLPTLPGEYTKLSSALALFKLARVLAKVLRENYPASASHEISFRTISMLSDELDAWLASLAPHLRLQFIQDKPSTNVISSRSPLLSMAYHYIRSLIYRPAVCASSLLGDRASSAIVALATSSKHIIQIIQLLEERRLSFTFCLNKAELLALSGFGLLFQGLDLDRNGALMKDIQRLLRSLLEILDRSLVIASIEFRRIISSLSMAGNAPMRSPMLSRHSSESNLSVVEDSMKATQQQMKAIASRFSSTGPGKFNRQDPHNGAERRATIPVATSIGQHLPNQSQSSISSIRSEPSAQQHQHHPRSEPALSPHLHRSSVTPVKQLPNKRPSARPSAQTNLDYLSFGEENAMSVTAAYPYATNTNGKHDVTPTDWERLLGALDNGQTTIYDTIYGGPPLDAIADVPPLSAAAQQGLAWGSPEMWTFSGGDSSSLGIPGQPPGSAGPQSVLSFSDESLTSGEEFPELVPARSDGETYRGLVIPELSPACGSVDAALGLTGLDGNFGL